MEARDLEENPQYPGKSPSRANSRERIFKLSYLRQFWELGLNTFFWNINKGKRFR